ncbi:GNAT family N-acetyltransferase [Bacillus sp. FJAT-49732]|uniref:GNAT family N-acetyltransferase n=1 Tax=Lederbergia citrisecunda TaxID=2833583 RepID=A0A942YMA6_9BACI|nr:GNAT family N-acetyltransferase [Lederbergia citrisecunda]MBS4201274.1 GNAT family N-acetyltransferase [Lederbergia citrisecunda]
MNLHITKELNNDDKKHIDNELFKYNLAHFPEDLRGRYEEISLYLRDENSNVRGAIIGAVCWNWLEIYSLIVDEEIRKFGFGTKLLLEIEKMAQDRQCDFIKVDTLSFQALGFYEKHGYKVFGSIDNVGRHFKHYYLKKDLNV